MSGENCEHIWRCWEPRCHVEFKTSSKLQCGNSVSSACRQHSPRLDAPGARELCAFEVAKFVNWKCWCHQLDCQSATSVLTVLENLTSLQGGPCSMMPGFILILIYTDLQRITWVCVFAPPPLYFFKWTKGGLRSSGVLTIHGSEPLQHFDQTGRNKK